MHLKTGIEEALNVKLGLVIPTLGTRQEMLEEALSSASSIQNIHIKIVSSSPEMFEGLERNGLAHSWTRDPGQGLAHAINIGISSLPSEITLVSWLGDDDKLERVGVERSISLLQEDSSIVATYGICKFINEQGLVFWTTPFGQEATALLSIGPNRLPQPGSIFRRSIFQEIGMLDTQLKYAFDLDFFIRLTKIGKVLFVPEQVAFFRWHSDSLSSGGRRNSEREARRVRRIHLPRHLVVLSWMWELPMLLSTVLPNRLDRLAKKITPRP